MKYLQNIKQLNGLANQVYASANVGQVDSFPENITVAVSNRCNYRCIMCMEWRRETDNDLPPETIEKLGDILPFVKTLYVTGGEPLMYPHLDMLFETALKAGCSLTMVTNGVLLTDKNIAKILNFGLFRVKFSLDAATQKTYAKIRGGNLQKVLMNIKKLAQAKIAHGINWPMLEVGFVAMRSNIMELPKFVSMAAGVGINHINVSYGVAHVEEMIPESLYFMQDEADQIMLAAKDMADHIGISLTLPNQLFKDAKHAVTPVDQAPPAICEDPWRSTFIWPDGRMSMCCGGGGNTGNLNNGEFMDEWNNKARVGARKLINTPHPPAQCKSCRTTRQNPNLTSSLFSGKVMDAAQNFIDSGEIPTPCLDASPAIHVD
ncbi:radical SAM protein [Pseudodesulfovibrio sediminis]|uniref:Radical SAM core domain-containing protein n=1 Tax=Pseudodesulfovibrio sediminis TaxID=2810563 RepID=A0ABN6ETF3_9BACT|nr:radical SAM protein [Pseudodesulfovibrio sediminis]BCS88386.1 hypothetical protein PSDVSF_16280 [Pseudodesulfovibrio sediminis]